MPEATTVGSTGAHSGVNGWGTGHTANMTLTAGSTNLSSWAVEFDTPATITNIGNGQITSHTGTHYVVSNVSYNGAVAAGKTTSFGYQATPGAVGSVPTNLKINGVAVGTSTPPITPSISIADVTVAEGNSGTANASFAVSLSKAATTPITVGYATANGTAKAGADYTAATGTVTFAPGVTTQTIAVKVTGDTVVEPAETFTVTLSNPTGATLARTTATATISNDDIATPPPSSGNTVAYSVVNDWGTGHTANMTLTAGSSKLSNWTVEFDTPATITSIWNGRITSHTGTHYVVSNMSYNGAVAAGRSTTFGYQATPGAVGSAPTNIKVNGVAIGTSTPPTAPAISIADQSVTEGNGEHSHFIFTVTMDKASTTPVSVGYATSNGTATAGTDYVAGAGTLTFGAGVTSQTVHVDVIGDTAVEPSETFKVTLSNASGATLARALATGTIVNDDTTTTPPATPGLSISDASATEPGSGGMAPGYLHTSGNQIVDAQGKPVQLSSVNWFGAESTTFAPHGLWTRSYKDMIDQMSSQGFNTIRLPYSSEMLHTTAKPNGIDFAQNPDLQGLSPIQVMDKVIDYAGEKGMRVVLDHHRSTAGAGTSENGLWYNSQYTEDQWVSDWQMLAARYKDDPTVIGFDLHNEPYNGTWGGGGANDWARAAERAGNAALAVNPNLLIFTEGVGTYKGQSYWWGGNLMGVKDRPITLTVPNRVVYSPHDYPNSVWAQPWFQTANFGANLPNVFRNAWGYIYEQNIAPIWVGEFGTKLQDPKDVVWFEAITSYLSGDFDNNGTVDIPNGTEDMSWSYWSWNPNSGDTGGILADDWRTVNTAKMSYLTPIEFTGGTGTSLASFTVTLAAPSTQTVTVQYATANGTATAGGDYTAASGTLTFAPGETGKTVTVAVKSDSLTEGAEDFHVMLSNPSGAVLTDAMGMGTITDRTAGTTTTGTTTTGTTTTGTTTYTDIMAFGMSHGSSHTGADALAGGRTAITTEALVAYNNLRKFSGLTPATLEDVGKWAFANSLTNNAQAWGDDLKGVGLYYAMQGAKVGWIADDKYSPQIVADIERTARLGSTADVMTMVTAYGHAGFAKYLSDNGYVTAFVDTLKMEPHYGGWMHDRANGRLLLEGSATAHDVNHLTVLSHDQTKPFMNDTWDWPQWPALNVSNTRVIEYFQSMVALGDPRGNSLTGLDRARV
ncbi:MAG: cellulase family glycosylhydrolase [Mycobacterium sp.]|nr:cellulase family glycosylhydrolase [Mycobacterium sp.]